jgi:hypothetical protein
MAPVVYIDNVKRRRWLKPVVTAAIVLAVVIGAAAAFLLVFTRPWDTTPTTADVVGVWQRGDTKERLILYSSHKMTFLNIPKGVIDWDGTNHDGATRRITTTGTWTSFFNEGYGPCSGYTHNDGGIDAGSDGQLYSQGFGGGRELVIYYGDDEQFQLDFHKISTKP